MALEAVFRFSCELVSGMSRCSGASYPSPPVQDMVWLTQAISKSGLRLYDRLHALSVQFWSNAGWGSGPCFEHLQKSVVPSEGGGPGGTNTCNSTGTSGAGTGIGTGTCF